MNPVYKLTHKSFGVENKKESFFFFKQRVLKVTYGCPKRLYADFENTLLPST